MKSKIAVIVSGELRVPDYSALHLFKDYFSDHAIYVSTYAEYEEVAACLTKNVLLIERDEISLPQNNMYQWYHLDRVLKGFDFSEYEVILKVRSDNCIFSKIETSQFDHVESDCFYALSDHSFYASTEQFYKCLGDFYDRAFGYLNKGHVYFPVNYDNILKSDIEALCYMSEDHHKELESRYGPVDKIKHIRFGIAINELVFPRGIYDQRIEDHSKRIEIYKKRVDELVANIKDEDLLENSIKQKIYGNQHRSGNKVFGSEKYFALEIINNSIVKNYKLPISGLLY